MYFASWPRSNHVPPETVAEGPSARQPIPPVSSTTQPPADASKRGASDGTEGSLTERVATLERMLSDAIANQNQAPYTEQLAAKGLSPSDSDRVVQTLFDELAACHFEATRRRYESYGVTFEQFLRGAEEIWGGTPAPERILSVSSVSKVAPQCVLQASQRAGIPIDVDLTSSPGPTAPADFGILAEPNLLRSTRVATDSSTWAGQMQAKLQAHVMRYPDVALDDLRIRCDQRACLVLMRGHGIQIFQFEFDVFAEQNGFASVQPYGDESQRMIWLFK